MKKLARFLGLAVIAFFILAGSATATTLTFNFTHPGDTEIWAQLTAYAPVYNAGTNDWTYEYMITNVKPTPLEITRLDIPVGDWTRVEFFESGAGVALMTDPVDTLPGKFVFLWDEIVKGDSSKHFGFTVDLAPGWGQAVLYNGGAGDPTWISTAKISYDSEPGSDYPPVPEPTTLLLVGSGLLGVAAVRRWNDKRSRKS